MVVSRKLVAVGDYCGKSFVLRTFLFDELPEPRMTQIDWNVTDVEVNGNVVELHVWDTCSREAYRTSIYKKTDVFLIFFSVFCMETLENVKKVWIEEVRKYGPTNVPVLLVGTHCKDFGRNRLDTKIQPEEVEVVVQEVGAVGYVECSAENKWNLEEVFVKAVAATL